GQRRASRRGPAGPARRGAGHGAHAADGPHHRALRVPPAARGRAHLERRGAQPALAAAGGAAAPGPALDHGVSTPRNTADVSLPARAGRRDLGADLSHVPGASGAHGPAGRGRRRGPGHPMKLALTIAGSDSGGGAGIQADLRTFAAHGLHGTSAITAVTAQNSVEVTSYVALEPAMVAAQIDAVASDMAVAAVKTGMLANQGIIAAVADAVARHH